MEEKKKSGLATAGMVLGIVGACTSFIPIVNNISFILGILAIIFGIIEIIKKAGRGKAIAGLVLGIIAIVITINMQKAVSDALDTLSDDLNQIANSTQEENLDLEKFNKIETGMTYEEVVGIIGEEGTVMSESEIGKTKTTMYSWNGKGSIGANANVTFQNNKVISKAQFGLK